MIEPFVAAFSASCSAKSTLAPRPATSDGARAARVTTGDAELEAEAGADSATRPVAARATDKRDLSMGGVTYLPEESQAVVSVGRRSPSRGPLVSRIDSCGGSRTGWEPRLTTQIRPV